jgi:dienelactone hydrolase
MYEFFPGNYRWSYNTWCALAAGGEFGDISLILPRLSEHEGDDDRWLVAWNWLAQRVEARAAERLENGSHASAADSYLLASLYHKISEQFVPPSDPRRLQSYESALGTFEQARALNGAGIERVLVPYEGAALPAYFVPSNMLEPAPTVIFICGLDTTKEITYLRVRNQLGIRGMNLLALDSPGVGEALRLGKVFTRYDYEVPVGSAISYLESRADVDPARIGIIGSSLGGYYVARAAAFEPRLRAAVAWGANYDYHAVWHRRLTVGGAIAAPAFQLTYITGTKTMEDAMERIENFRLAPIAHQITCPILIAHGAEDQQIPVDDARAVYDAVASRDKTLKIFKGEDGGAAHCQFDNHYPALRYVADWLAAKL